MFDAWIDVWILIVFFTFYHFIKKNLLSVCQRLIETFDLVQKFPRFVAEKLPRRRIFMSRLGQCVESLLKHKLTNIEMCSTKSRMWKLAAFYYDFPNPWLN